MKNLELLTQHLDVAESLINNMPMHNSVLDNGLMLLGGLGLNAYRLYKKYGDAAKDMPIMKRVSELSERLAEKLETLAKENVQ